MRRELTTYNNGTYEAGRGRITIPPAGSTSLSGGSAAFDASSADFSRQAAAPASITAFQVRNISSESSPSAPHVVMGIQF